MKQPVNYKQFDKRWKNVSYSTVGESTTIGRAGCGTTCSAMVIATLKDKSVTPVTTSKWSVLNGYKYKGGGTHYGYFVPQLELYGIGCERINTTNNYGNKCGSYSMKAQNALRERKWLICCVGKGVWTSGGHYILVYGLLNGEVYVNDPASNSSSRAKNKWSNLENQTKYYWIIDAPEFPRETNPYKEPSITLKKNYIRGIKASEGVKWLQWELQRKSFYLGKVDGYFGPQTECAFRKFQDTNPGSYYPSKTPDLKCGKKSRALLKL